MAGVPKPVMGPSSSHAEEEAFVNQGIISELPLYFMKSNDDIIQCGYQKLVHYLEGHGLSMGTWSLSEARNMLMYHLLHGMCSSQRGDQCKMIGQAADKRAATAIILAHLSNLCQQSLISLSDLRFICNATGLLVVRVRSVDEMFRAMHTSLTTDQILGNGFDLLHFFSVLDKATKFELICWCWGMACTHLEQYNQ